MGRLTALTFVGAMVLAACGQPGDDAAIPDGVGGATDGQPGGAPQDAGEQLADEDAPVNPFTGEPLPPLDVGNSVVAIEDVHFDTFTGGSVPLAEADDSLIDRLRDAIIPIYVPGYEDAGTAAAWLPDGDLVLGVVGDDGAFAYPHRILNFHEIVHEDVDGVPVLVTYCPLCQSGVVFDRRHGDRTLTFGNTSALYESDMVMFDWETNSYWWQVPGLAIVGEMAGESLTVLPSQTMTFAEWRALHPETVVLARPGPAERYQRDPFAALPEFLDGGGEPFPLSDAAQDGRLPPSTIVLGVEIGDDHAVYVVESLAGRVVMDTVGDEPIVLFGSSDGTAASVFLAQAGGRALTFEASADEILDRETGSTWNRSGGGTSGPLAGTQLDGAPSRTTFWFAYVAAFPDLDLRTPETS